VHSTLQPLSTASCSYATLLTVRPARASSGSAPLNHAASPHPHSHPRARALTLRLFSLSTAAADSSEDEEEVDEEEAEGDLLVGPGERVPRDASVAVELIDVAALKGRRFQVRRG
jgi:hypothetical protein